MAFGVCSAMEVRARGLFLVLLVTLLPLGAAAQSRTPDLTHASIEDLMNIEITSAARKEQRAADVPGAIFVITQEDIRRSGMTTLPDVLRLAPGVDVAQVNANKWAVSVRGFNGVFANKLLILVDGHSIYNRIFSGVLWDAEDPVLDDIERIEVIRGPGAALWGANAVNGVINIITKAAGATQGGLVRVDGGRPGEQGVARYGGTAGAAEYRAYAQWTRRDESLIVPGTRARDASHSTTSGFRVDWKASPDAFTVEGNFTAGQTRALWPNLDPQTAARTPFSDDVTDNQGGYLSGRWTHTRPDGASLQLQSSVDITSRQEPITDYDRRAFDIDTQYHTAWGAHHDLVAGARYQFTRETFIGHAGFSLTPTQDDGSLASAFVQDEIALFDRRLAVTLGSQVQYDSYSGAGIQPTARVMWRPVPHHGLWAATSRALRTPSLEDRGIRVTLPPAPSPAGLPLVVSTVGNPSADTETLREVEAGYRIEFGMTASIDITGFSGRYDRLQTTEPGAPVVQFVPSPQILVTAQFGNLLAASTRGVEIAGNWTPVPAWRLSGSYSSFHITPEPAAASRDASAAVTDANAPQNQWQLHSTVHAGPQAVIDVALYYAGRLEQQQVPGYTRGDVHFEWRFTNHLSAAAIFQNIFDAAHPEFTTATSFMMATQVPRSASLRLRWLF